jgi:hypothetical protein
MAAASSRDSSVGALLWKLIRIIDAKLGIETSEEKYYSTEEDMVVFKRSIILLSHGADQHELDTATALYTAYHVPGASNAIQNVQRFITWTPWAGFLADDDDVKDAELELVTASIRDSLRTLEGDSPRTKRAEHAARIAATEHAASGSAGSAGSPPRKKSRRLYDVRL